MGRFAPSEILLRRGLHLEYATLLWNIVGSIIVISLAISAHSVALAGFGLDTVIEIGASLVVIWQLNDINDNRERIALRLISVAFFALAVYVATQSSCALWFQIHPITSIMGMVWLALTFVVMLGLAAAKHTTGSKLNNRILKTEAKVTLVDAYLAASVLLGLVLNAFFSWWWADPVAGFVIVYYGYIEGHHAWSESSDF
jgi:divalent metal cation (Fe/Co/Zn/Cd) transporter